MKLYTITNNVGSCKYCVAFHDGVKKHQDNSPFYDVRLFNNTRDMVHFTCELRRQGYSKS